MQILKNIYHCPLQADILFLCLRREKNLCEQPFAFPMSIKTNVKCKNMFNKQNNNFAHASHIFCTFLGRFARRDYVVETPNFAFGESLDNQRRNFFF